MYVGRLILLGYSEEGDIAAVYRLASRSFRHRRIALAGDLATVRPKPGFEFEAVLKNLTPYYCLGLVKKRGILAANGRHFPTIFSRISRGDAPARSIQEVLQFFGPEKDEFSTPRICGFVSESDLLLGIVSDKGVDLRIFPRENGKGVYISTYIRTDPAENLVTDFHFSSIHDLARQVHEGVVFQRFSHGICSVAGTVMNERFALAVWP
jgi:IMP cyclohydrolase